MRFKTSSLVCSNLVLLHLVSDALIINASSLFLSSDQLSFVSPSRWSFAHGICSVREALHSQHFDEIVRQITLNDDERGSLLVRDRDKIKMTIQMY